MSRYPGMSQRPAYDQTLLAGAPSVSREDRQAGYDPSALESGNYGAPMPTGNATSRPAGAQEYPTTTDPFADPYAQERPYSPSMTRSTKKPWWTTKRGRWGLALAVIILIGLIAGIAAGTAAARNAQNRTLLENGTTESPQGLENSSSTSRIQALPSSSSPSSSTPPSSLQPSASDSVVQQPSPSAPAVTRTTLVASPTPDTPVQPPVGNSPGTTITFGAPASPTAPGSPGSSTDPADDIPLFCYIVPHSSACAPYFENYPPRR